MMRFSMQVRVVRILGLCLWQALLIVAASAQVLTHGPVVGGVTGSSANVFVRSDQAASVALRYGTDPNLAIFAVSGSLTTSDADDFTKVIPLSGLLPETTYYLCPTVNGTPQIAAPPYPSFKSFAVESVSRNFKFVVMADFVNVDSLTRTTTAFSNAAAELPDFVFIGGDFDHRNPKALQAKQVMFKELYGRSTPYMSGFVPFILDTFPIARQWDDHDAGKTISIASMPTGTLARKPLRSMSRLIRFLGYAGDLAEVPLCPGRVFFARLPQPKGSGRRCGR